MHIIEKNTRANSSFIKAKPSQGMPEFSIFTPPSFYLILNGSQRSVEDYFHLMNLSCARLTPKGTGGPMDAMTSKTAEERHLSNGRLSWRAKFFSLIFNAQEADRCHMAF